MEPEMSTNVRNSSSTTPSPFSDSMPTWTVIALIVSSLVVGVFLTIGVSILYRRLSRKRWYVKRYSQSLEDIGRIGHFRMDKEETKYFNIGSGGNVESGICSLENDIDDEILSELVPVSLSSSVLHVQENEEKTTFITLHFSESHPDVHQLPEYKDSIWYNDEGEYKTRSHEQTRGRGREPTERETSSSQRAIYKETLFSLTEETVQKEIKLSSPPVSEGQNSDNTSHMYQHKDDDDCEEAGYQESHELCLPHDISETDHPRINWNKVFNYLAKNIIRPSAFQEFFSELFTIENSWNIIEEINLTNQPVRQKIVQLFHLWKQTAGSTNLEVSIQEVFRNLQWNADLDKFNQYMRNPPTLQEQASEEHPEGTFDISVMNSKGLQNVLSSVMTHNKIPVNVSDDNVSHVERTVTQKVIRHGRMTETVFRQTVGPQSYDAEDSILKNRKRKQKFLEYDKDHPRCRENKCRKLNSSDGFNGKKDYSRKPYVKSTSGRYKSEERIKTDLFGKSRRVLVITRVNNKPSGKYPQFKSKSKKSTRTSVEVNGGGDITGRKSVTVFSRNNGEFLSSDYNHGYSSEWNFCPSVSGLCTGNISVRGIADGCDYKSENEKSAIITLVEKLIRRNCSLDSHEYEVFVKTILERFSKKYQPTSLILEIKMDDLERKMSGFFLPKGESVVAFSNEEWKLLQLYLETRSKLSCSAEVDEVIVTYNGVPLKDA